MTLKYRNLDWKLIGAALALSCIGIVLIMSAQSHAASTYERTYFLRQLIWLVFALGVFAVVIHVSPRLYDLSAYLLYGVSVLLLLLVLFAGTPRMGAMRWFSFGPINLAPSDIAKVTLVLALSRFLAYTKMPPLSKRLLAITGLMALVPLVLVTRQPDLGTSLVFIVILLVLWFWSGIPVSRLLLVLSPVIALAVLILSPLATFLAQYPRIPMVAYFAVLLLILYLVRPGVVFSVLTVTANLVAAVITQYLWNGLAGYQQERLRYFLDPGSDPRGAGYQIIQSKIAIGSGGLTGKGLLEGPQTRLDFLPEAHTDFIFSVLGEELGLIGGLVVLALFFFIFHRAIRIAGKCRSRFASNVVMGATAVLLFQLFVNVGMTLGFMPVTGLALPFVSYGGTSLVLCWALLGFIVLADYHWQEY